MYSMMLLGRHDIFDETIRKSDAYNTRAGQRDRIHGLTHHRRQTRSGYHVPTTENHSMPLTIVHVWLNHVRTFEGHKSFSIFKACPGCVARLPKLTIPPRRQSSEACDTRIRLTLTIHLRYASLLNFKSLRAFQSCQRSNEQWSADHWTPKPGINAIDYSYSCGSGQRPYRFAI